MDWTAGRFFTAGAEDKFCGGGRSLACVATKRPRPFVLAPFRRWAGTGRTADGAHPELRAEIVVAGLAGAGTNRWANRCWISSSPADHHRRFRACLPRGGPRQICASVSPNARARGVSLLPRSRFPHAPHPARALEVRRCRWGHQGVIRFFRICALGDKHPKVRYSETHPRSILGENLATFARPKSRHGNLLLRHYAGEQ